MKSVFKSLLLLETPPHTWRKSRNARVVSNIGGNTSTYVEKIVSCSLITFLQQKHLHIRGENCRSRLTGTDQRETPPHTWRKSTKTWKPSGCLRNTSTYVEKIYPPSLSNADDQKHLHIRGENFLVRFIVPLQTETPPHTWRKSTVKTTVKAGARNTSTYVEKIK